MRLTPCLILASLALAFVPPPIADSDAAEEGEAAGQQPLGAVLRWRQRVDANGRIDGTILWKEALALKQRQAAAPLAAGPVNWTVLGPGNIGGRIRSILIDPVNPSNMYIGSVGGGVWKSTTAGASWTMLPDLPAVIAVTCMVMHPNDPNTIWAGTGEECFFLNLEGSSVNAIMLGAGLFKTTDAGNTWVQIPSTKVPAWNAISRLTIDKNNPLIMVASTISGIWRSADGGNTWTQRTNVKTLDVKIDPNNSANYVAGRSDGIAQYSTDYGVTWTSASAFPNVTRVELAYARSAPGTVFASTSVQGANLTVWRSTNGGQSWTLQTTGNVVSNLANYTSAIWVDPTDANRVIVGGLDLYRSTNAGMTFTKISSWGSYPTYSAHADHHVIVEHPAFNGTTNLTVYFGSDGGCQRATNFLTVTSASSSSSGWTNMNNGLVITQYYGICMNPTSGVALGGAQDNGTSRGTPTSGLVWTQPGGGDGSFCASDPNDPNYFYMQSQYIGLGRSSNGGTSTNANNFTSGLSDAGNSAVTNFMSYILLDPNDSNRLYVCGASLWRANNAKTGSPPTWTAVKPAMSCPAAHYLDNPPCAISTVAVAKGNANVVWVGHNNGALFYTTNGLAAAPSWTRVDNNTPPLPDRWVSRIAIDPTDTNRVTVSFMGYNPDNVWRTTDSGVNWIPRYGTGAGALPPIPVSCIVQHRVIGTRFYASTDLGLYYTEDDGLNWKAAVGGPGIVSTDEIVWKNDRTLVVGTHGRGMWTCDVDPASVTPVGTGCGLFAVPGLTVGAPAIGTSQAYTLANASPNAPASLLLAAGPPQPLVLGPCTIQPALANMVALSIGTTNASGGLVYNLPLPANPAFVGAIVTAQELTLVAGGPLLSLGELSNGAQLTFGF